MAGKSLIKELGLEKRAPLPPKYQPKVTLRVSCSRSKQVYEFHVSTPIEGTAPEAFSEMQQKLSDICEKLGILPSTKKPVAENTQNAEWSLQTEEGQSAESEAGQGA